MRKTHLLLLFFTLLVLVPGCKNGNGGTTAAAAAQVRYMITQSYGQEILLEKEISLKKDSTVMDGLLETGAAVETSYGGSFISAINGLKNEHAVMLGERKDWFYFVNGIFADTGALDYFPQTGEIIWWDYHPWKTVQNITAVIGCFPEPFLHGYRGQLGPTVILTAQQDAKDGFKLQKALEEKGVAQVVTGEITDSLLEKRKGPTVVIGEWKTLEGFSWMAALNAAYRRNGTFLHFAETGLELLDYNGQLVRTVQNGAGVILAQGEGNGDNSPLWLVTGTDRNGLEAALEVLISQPHEIKGAYNAVVLQGEIIRLPLMR